MIILGIVRALGVLVYAYLLWRKMREDYKEERILSFGWVSLLVFLAGSRLAYGLANWGVFDGWQDWLLIWSKPGMIYFAGYTAVILTVFAYCFKYDWKLWSFLEDITPVFLTYLIFLIGDELIRSRFDFGILVELLVLIAVLTASGVAAERYRSIHWYQSGKKGFVFFFANCWYALLTAGLYFWLKADLWLAGMMMIWSLISLTGLFMLGGTRLQLAKKGGK